MRIGNLVFFLLIPWVLIAQAQQDHILKGRVMDGSEPVAFANIYITPSGKGTASDAEGYFRLVLPQQVTTNHELNISALGYKTQRHALNKLSGQSPLIIALEPDSEVLEETVITGTLKAVRRSESPVPVEVYAPTFIKKNPTSNLFESLQLVNGIRPQINCNVCNTGDIHINGLEGPYTLVLIDGMPIVSGLGTVYGLSGIPNALIEQIEIIKGPASSLYGSEAVGGLINVITKNPFGAPEFFMDSFLTGWGEYNLDAGGKISIGEKADLLLGLNYFNFNQPIDQNGDNFTDLTLQDRISFFQKWQIRRPKGRVMQFAGRFFYEDRWGGELQWTPEFRGGDVIYGESIYTRRWEVLGRYQLPLVEKVLFSFSFNDHNQNSVYGDTPYLASQQIGFGQLTWDKELGKHELLAGAALRYNAYDDNTPATAMGTENNPDQVWLPGLFLQDQWSIAKNHSLLTGVRLDYDRRHGTIFTPRMAYRLKMAEHNILRLNAGTGFRVVNLFTEDHAALTGAREVIIEESLEPERSWNVNLNFLKKIYSREGNYFGLDVTAFYTHFENAIIPDYDSNPNEIRYRNLDGRAISAGVSANLDLSLKNGFRAGIGATIQEVNNRRDGVTRKQILTEQFMGTWNLSYSFNRLNLSVDYTGNIYGPMRLPLLGPLDPRAEFSPVWSIQNIQFTYSGFERFECYLGVKNLLDWTPNRGNPFIIARANDPFDRDVEFDPSGNPVATANNPYALTFDPSYVYGPNQGIRAFFGLRYRIP